jgi:hypothetical protein
MTTRFPNPPFVIATYRTFPLPFSPIVLPTSPPLPAMHKTPPSMALKPAATRAFLSDPYRTYPLPPLSLPPAHK